MEFEQQIQIADSVQPWARTCWSMYDTYSFVQLQREYRRLAEKLAAKKIDNLDRGSMQTLLGIWGERATEESVAQHVMWLGESQLNCLGRRLEYQYLLQTDSIQWFS